MGGNALSSPSVRLNRPMYEKVSTQSIFVLKQLYPTQRIAVLEAFKSKETFGDCDILIESSPEYDPMRAAAALGGVEVVVNGPVASVGLLVDPELPKTNNMFQVDLFKVPPASFEFAWSYFKNGDCGNLLGRLFHAMGLALCDDGLIYYYRDEANGGYKFRKIVVTLDFAEALRFLKVDPAKYAAGFQTSHDIYDYVRTSPYFNKDIYLLENQNAKSRVRDRKRVMYMQFLDYCRELPEAEVIPSRKSKADWLPKIMEAFPQFKPEYYQAKADLERIHLVKAKFSGELVRRITGLDGKPLGAVMQHFKESFGTLAEMQEFVLTANPEQLANKVLQIQKTIVV